MIKHINYIKVKNGEIFISNSVIPSKVDMGSTISLIQLAISVV